MSHLLLSAPRRLSARIHRGQRTRLALLSCGLAFCALALPAQAVTPAPDGGYPSQNTAEGTDALFSLDPSVDTGSDNTGIGYRALYANTTGVFNTAVGSDSLEDNVSGIYNTAVGSQGLTHSTGSYNVAVGALALSAPNMSGENNVAVGSKALWNDTAGGGNTAIGADALGANKTGSLNTATGSQALLNNTGNYNTGHGQGALKLNTTGELNTASGTRALYSNSTGGSNSAQGAQALLFNTVGNNNTADGASALMRNVGGVRNTAMGAEALANNKGGDGNIAVGYQAGLNLTTGNNNIDIGALGNAGESNVIRIGKADTHQAAFLQGVYGKSVSNGLRVTINSAGKLGVEQISSARFKEEIKPMEEASDALLELRPVTFRYKHEVDDADLPQFGLVAEEVEKVNPALVLRDAEGRVNVVRYEAVNAMLLNEFLKEHRTVSAQAQTLGDQARRLDEQGATIAELRKQVDALTAGLQKVSTEVQLQRAEAQVAASR